MEEEDNRRMDRTISSPFADFMRNNDPGKIGDGISDGDGNGSLIDSSSSEHHDNYLAGAAATPTPTANASSISNAKLPDYYRQDAPVTTPSVYANGSAASSSDFSHYPSHIAQHHHHLNNSSNQKRRYQFDSRPNLKNDLSGGSREVNANNKTIEIENQHQSRQKQHLNSMISVSINLQQQEQQHHKEEDERNQYSILNPFSPSEIPEMKNISTTTQKNLPRPNDISNRNLNPNSNNVNLSNNINNNDGSNGVKNQSKINNSSGPATSRSRPRPGAPSLASKMPHFSARLGKRCLLWRNANCSQIQQQQQRKDVDNSVEYDTNSIIPTKNSKIQVECAGCGTVVECFKASVVMECPNCHELHPTVICRLVQ